MFVLISLILIFTSAEFSVIYGLASPKRFLSIHEVCIKYGKLTFLLHLPQTPSIHTRQLPFKSASHHRGVSHSTARPLPCTGPSSRPPCHCLHRACLTGWRFFLSPPHLPVCTQAPRWYSPLNYSALHPLDPQLPLTLGILPLFWSKPSLSVCTPTPIHAHVGEPVVPDRGEEEMNRETDVPTQGTPALLVTLLETWPVTVV